MNLQQQLILKWNLNLILEQDHKERKEFITDLISLGIQGFTAFNTNRKVNQLKKGMKKLFEQQHHLGNKVVRLEDDMTSLAHVAIEGLQHLQGELIRQGRHIRNLTSRVRRLEITLTNMHAFASQIIQMRSGS